jgi:hypothetical protein
MALGMSQAWAADQDASDGSSPGDSEYKFRVGGFVRTWGSFNLQDHPDGNDKGAGTPSMLRGSVELNGDLTTGPLQWHAVGRVDREVLTPYERQLQNEIRANSPGGPGSSLLGQYNQTELREFYVDVDPLERVHLRLGKQQIVWGETDFFHPTDLIQGYDYRWRSFLEGESDELRKPLITANATVKFPEVNGNLQLVLRPGLDRERDIGNSYDLYGGRWAAQPFKGVDFLAPGFLNYDYRHPSGDTHSPTGGVRWTGIVGSVNYAFSYLNTYKPDPVVNSAFAPYGKKPTGALGDFIFPKINVYDASVSGDIPALDATLSAEVAYQSGVAYNIGTNFMGGALPGFDGVLNKNVVVSTLRFDKQLKLQGLLGTNQASFFSVQLFDTWIQHFKRSDDLVEQVGFGAPAQEHTTLLTAFVVLNYMNSRLNPGFAVGANVETGDAFMIPSVNVAVGDHWRLNAEADIFLPHHSKRPGEIETSTHGLADFANNDQFLIRATYQF